MASPIDQLYESIFGGLPTKSGTAYERLAAIATFFLSEGEVRHDARVRGAVSASMYQLDVHQVASDSQSMGEAKDYSERGAKVGRDDLQKLAGALIDLGDIKEATFWSATGFTKPAMQYASAAEQMTGKPIRLFGLRPSTELDEQGFIKTIHLRGTISVADVEAASWTAHWTVEGCQFLRSLIPEGQTGLEVHEHVEAFYDKCGVPRLSIFDLTSSGFGEMHEDGSSYGCFLLKGLFMKVNGHLVPVLGYEYCMPYVTHTCTVEITDDSVHRLVVLNSEGVPVRMLTDEKIRQFSFDSEGNLIPPADFARQS